MKVKTSTLTRAALNWAVAMAAGYTDVQISAYEDQDTPDECFFRPGKVVDGIEICGSGLRWEPSTNWAHGGPILGKHWKAISAVAIAWCLNNVAMQTDDEPLLEFWMRCFVASVMGEEVDVPEELL
jgi:hypothetical protein